MRRTLFAALTCVIAAFALTSVASASGGGNGGNSDVAKQCAALKKADKAAFKAVYGPKHAMKNCVKAGDPVSADDFQNAAQACRAERTADPDVFRETYGSAHSQGHNAFGKCVSVKTHA